MSLRMIVDLVGELDLLSAEKAVGYVTDVIACFGGPVVVDLVELTFCDVRGLGALLRLASYAERAGNEFRLAWARPSLVKIMRITRLDGMLFASQAACPAGS